MDMLVSDLPQNSNELSAVEVPPDLTNWWVFIA